MKSQYVNCIVCNNARDHEWVCIKLFKTQLMLERGIPCKCGFNIADLTRVFLVLHQLMGLKVSFLLIPQMYFIFKVLKTIYLTVSCSIGLISMYAHYFSMQNAVNTSC